MANSTHCTAHVVDVIESAEAAEALKQTKNPHRHPHILLFLLFYFLSQQ